MHPATACYSPIKISSTVKIKTKLNEHASYLIHNSRGQDVIPWDLLAEIDFFVLSYSLTLS